MAIERKTMEVLVVNGRNIEVSISEGRSKDLYNGIVENTKKGIGLYFENCEKLLELRDSKGFYQLGYDSFKDMCSDLFETGDTQGKEMCLIASSYGTTHTDGRVEILNKEELSKWTPTQLGYIRKLALFDGNIAHITTAYPEVTPATTCASLRDLLAHEKLALEEKKASEGNGEGTNKTVSITDEAVDKALDNATQEDNSPVESTQEDNSPVESTQEDNSPEVEMVLDIKLSELKRKLQVGMTIYADLGHGMNYYTII